MLITFQLMSLQVFWPQREYHFCREPSKGDAISEVQLLFTTVPSEIGWYSLAYNASATGISDGMNFDQIPTNLSFQLELSFVEASLQ